MQLIDTHTHIYSEEFDEDRDAVVSRAKEAGIVKMLLPAIDSTSIDRQEALAERYPDLFRQMIGLHPTSVTEDFEGEMALVERKLKEHPKEYVAIGEIGLDLYWDATYKYQQIEVLKRQMLLAEQYDLPVELHIRNAYGEMFEVLKDLNRAQYKGVFHCYSGTLEEAYKAVEMGFYLGIGGVLTYKKSILPDIVKAISLNKLVLETDSPYLAPVPYRGKRNESSYVAEVARKMALVKEVDIEEIATKTTRNAVELFKL